MAMSMTVTATTKTVMMTTRCYDDGDECCEGEEDDDEDDSDDDNDGAVWSRICCVAWPSLSMADATCPHIGGPAALSDSSVAAFEWTLEVRFV